MRAIDDEESVFSQERLDTGDNLHTAGLGYRSSEPGLARTLFHLIRDLLNAYQEKRNIGIAAR